MPKLDWRHDVIPAVGEKIKEILAKAEKAGKPMKRSDAMKQAWKSDEIKKLMEEYRKQKGESGASSKSVKKPKKKKGGSDSDAIPSRPKLTRTRGTYFNNEVAMDTAPASAPNISFNFGEVINENVDIKEKKKTGKIREKAKKVVNKIKSLAKKKKKGGICGGGRRKPKKRTTTRTKKPKRKTTKKRRTVKK